MSRTVAFVNVWSNFPYISDICGKFARRRKAGDAQGGSRCGRIP